MEGWLKVSPKRAAKQGKLSNNNADKDKQKNAKRAVFGKQNFQGLWILAEHAIGDGDWDRITPKMPKAEVMPDLMMPLIVDLQPTGL